MASDLTTDGIREMTLLMTIREAAKALRISERTLWRIMQRGDLQTVRIGHCLRFDPADLRAYVERQKTGGKAAEEKMVESS